MPQTVEEEWGEDSSLIFQGMRALPLEGQGQYGKQQR